MSNYTVLHCHTELSNGTTNIDSVTKYLFLESFTDEGQKKIRAGEDVGFNGFNV